MVIAKSITVVLLVTLSVFAQTQTTGRIAGTVKDQQEALIARASVVVTNQANGEDRTTVSDSAGNFAVAFLAPGVYRVRIEFGGFNIFNTENITVSLTETTSVSAVLTVAGITDSIIVHNDAALIKTDRPTLGQVFDGQVVADLPLATRNFTQLFGLAPGTSAFLTDNTAIGRNTQNVSVNGARLSQNNFQINGIDSNFGPVNSRQIAGPAPESIGEFKIQTSLYDATYGRAGGGSVQTVTRSGTNKLSGAIYEYFGDTALNANNPFLKAAGLPRPVLKRDIFGVAIGGAIKKDRAFFFGSFQTLQEWNGASRLNSVSSNVLIGTSTGTNFVALTDDRSATTLSAKFGVPVSQIHPVALALLNKRLANGQYVIPTPQDRARYSGSAVSKFREEQLNSNFDFRLTERNWISAKIFFAHAPQVSALLGNVNVPGFPTKQKTDSLLVSIQDVQSFDSGITNAVRVGLNLFDGDDASQPPFRDSDVGSNRPTADAFPGFPIISIAGAAGGIQFGTAALNYQRSKVLTPTLGDTISFTHRSHSIRAGLEFRYYLFNIDIPIQTRGNITFANFSDFLLGIPQQTRIGNGITDRAFRAADYNLFVQDDWKFSPKLTFNLGLRYELDLPAYETRGRIATFDPTLYRPSATLTGPPLGGIVQARNSPAGYDLPDIGNVGKRILNSIDANNFAPRVGLAYVPFDKIPFALRVGYGIYYSRSALAYLVSNIAQPPFYFNTILANPARVANFQSPFAPNVPTQFPTLTGSFSGISFDRNIRTPYFQQFNAAAQFAILHDTTLEIAYVGSRGLNLFRQVAINQARLASPQNPVFDPVTMQNVISNTPADAMIRAPFQGVALGSGFLQDQSTAQSTYHSLQINVTRRLSRGLQFQVSYTLSKSIDNASGGGGAGTNGLTDTLVSGDTGVIIGNQLDSRANRGLSNFDRRHRFVSSFTWQLPRPAFTKRSRIGRNLSSGWQIAGIAMAMSGSPIDVVDSLAGSFYLGVNGGGARPNFVQGISPMGSIPNGYYFNPFAFARPTVVAGQIIPSSNGMAIASATGTDFGNVGRNILSGPKQFNTDFSIGKRFPISETKKIEFRAEIFNLFNNVNYANPISNFAAVQQSGGSIDPISGRINVDNSGDFGKIISTSNNPRIVQLAVKFKF